MGRGWGVLGPSDSPSQSSFSSSSSSSFSSSQLLAVAASKKQATNLTSSGMDDQSVRSVATCFGGERRAVWRGESRVARFGLFEAKKTILIFFRSWLASKFFRTYQVVGLLKKSIEVYIVKSIILPFLKQSLAFCHKHLKTLERTTTVQQFVNRQPPPWAQCLSKKQKFQKTFFLLFQWNFINYSTINGQKKSKKMDQRHLQ